MLDVVLVVPQPTQCYCSLPIERVVGRPELRWSFELRRRKASNSSGHSCFDQMYLVWPSDCGNDSIDAAKSVLQVVGIVVVHDSDLKTASGECRLGLDQC